MAAGFRRACALSRVATVSALAAGLVLGGPSAPAGAETTAATATTAPATNPSAASSAALNFAKAQLGKPYEWGSTGPDSYDCSGLTYASYREAGIAIPRTSVDQYGAGSHVPVTALLPGDLVFWGSDVNNPATIYHVSMYVGDGNVIDAPHADTVVQVRAMWTTGLLALGTRPNTPTGLRISATPSIYLGEYAHVDGRLVSAITGGPVGGAPVAVYGRRIGTPTWSLLASLTTDAAGLIHYARAIGGDAEFALRYAATPGYTAAASPNATVLVKPARTATGLRISATPSITFGDYARVDGRLVSAATGGPIGGQPVTVYGRRVGTPTWTLLAGLTTDPAGLVHYARIIGGDAEFTLRFAGSTSLTAAASPNATVLVKPIPTTLRISATPTTISLGQATTVGGRLVATATGAYQAGEPLTVYGRRLGTTTWAALARITTDSTGLIQYTRYIGGSAEFQLVFPGSTIRSPSTSPVIRVYVT